MSGIPIPKPADGKPKDEANEGEKNINTFPSMHV